VVGAAEETDSEIVKYMWGLYDRLNLKRIYFSAYQKSLGGIRDENESLAPPVSDGFLREHRLYQVDFLMRKYDFSESDFSFDSQGNLPLGIDPKQHWANLHPEYFPVNVNRASKFELLRVPGLGEITVNRILQWRKNSTIRRIDDIGRLMPRLEKANEYLSY